MTFEKFEKIVNNIRVQDEAVHSIYMSNIDLFDFVSPYQDLIYYLIEEIYGKDGVDWWSWFCYENNFGNGTLEAWDEGGVPICYDLRSLWEYLEKNKRDE